MELILNRWLLIQRLLIETYLVYFAVQIDLSCSDLSFSFPVLSVPRQVSLSADMFAQQLSISWLGGAATTFDLMILRTELNESVFYVRTFFSCKFVPLFFLLLCYKLVAVSCDRIFETDSKIDICMFQRLDSDVLANIFYITIYIYIYIYISIYIYKLYFVCTEQDISLHFVTTHWWSCVISADP